MPEVVGTVETGTRRDVRKLQTSLTEVVVSRKEEKTKQHEYTKVTAKFHVFKVVRSNDIIFIMDHPRAEELDCQHVSIHGIAGDFCGIVRRIGFVDGEIRTDASIYRITDEALSIQRVTGVSLRRKLT